MWHMVGRGICGRQLEEQLSAFFAPVGISVRMHSSGFCIHARSNCMYSDGLLPMLHVSCALAASTGHACLAHRRHKRQLHVPYTRWRTGKGGCTHAATYSTWAVQCFSTVLPTVWPCAVASREGWLHLTHELWNLGHAVLVVSACSASLYLWAAMERTCCMLSLVWAEALAVALCLKSTSKKS